MYSNVFLKIVDRGVIISTQFPTKLVFSVAWCCGEKFKQIIIKSYEKLRDYRVLGVENAESVGYWDHKIQRT